MAAPRKTKRPIPRTQAGWRKEVDGITDYLQRLSGLVLDHGQQWADSQGRYYRARRWDLLIHPPKGIRRVGDGYIVVVDCED